MQVKALLFDLGRVVIDIDFTRVVASWARASALEPEALLQRFDRNVRGAMAYHRHERGEVSDEAFFREIGRALELDLDEASLRQGWDDIFVGEMPGIDTLLRDASARYPLYALSNTNPSHHAVFSKRFADVLAHFRKLYLSHEMGLRKPDPEIYRGVARELALAPQELLFFDDLADNVAAARAVGMEAVQVSTVADIRAALAHDR